MSLSSRLTRRFFPRGASAPHLPAQTAGVTGPVADFTLPVEQLLSVADAHSWVAAPSGGAAQQCACCGAQGTFTVQRQPVCVTCASVFSFGKPGLDERAALIWLPWFTQGALNRLVGGHLQATHRAIGSGKSSAGMAHLDEILHAAREAATRKLGVVTPSALLDVLDDPATRAAFAGSGIRLLPLGVWQRENGRNAFFENAQSTGSVDP